MKTRAVGRQDLKVSAIDYGAMLYAGPDGKTDTAAMMATVQHAVDLPVTLFDTAQKQAWIADALGYKGMAADAIAALIADLGLPTRLRDVGVREDQLDQIAEGSMQNNWVQANPVPVNSPAKLRSILDAAY